jgi:hypothetical protein
MGLTLCVRPGGSGAVSQPEEQKYCLVDPTSIHRTFLPAAGMRSREGAPDA